MDAELVEKVVLAIRACPARPGGYVEYEDIAQAAIAAVLEHLSAVTPEMVEAGAKAFNSVLFNQPVDCRNALPAHEAAYLAMLAKVKP